MWETACRNVYAHVGVIVLAVARCSCLLYAGIYPGPALGQCHYPAKQGGNSRYSHARIAYFGTPLTQDSV